MKLAVVLFLLFIESTNSYSQYNVQYDTVNIIRIKRVDTPSNKIYESSTVFFIGGVYYHGNNFPFASLKAKCPEKEKNKLFYLEYSPLINLNSIHILKTRLKKKNFQRIDTIPNVSINNNTILSKETTSFLNCVLLNNKKVYLVSEQKVIAAFLLLDCGVELGVHDSIFCRENVNTSATVVLLNVTDIIN